MTEQEWLACTDPMPMQEYLRGGQTASERKLRLVALAFSRRFLHLLSDERSRQAIELAERFVEGKVTHRERAIIAAAAWEAVEAARREQKTGAEVAAALAAARIADSDSPLFAQRFGSSGEVGQQYAWSALRDSVFFTDKKDQCACLRDVFGPFQFRPIIIDPAWLAWDVGTIPIIAQAIYDERAFDRLPVLADALVDGGCDNADILNHCRIEGPHVRGCWVVDLILGKE